MPIKNLTDRDTLKPRPPRLGKLRKGGEKKGNKPGADLDHFRFTSDNPEVVAAFQEIYGKEPRVINATMYYHTYEECFSSWVESWDASGLVFRSDGEFWHIWREGDRYKRGQKPHTDAPDQSEIGRLEFVIPELWEAGFRGTVTLETSSNHDLRQIGGVLLAAEEGRDSLRGLPFTLRRVQEEIGVPGWGDRKGQRSKAEKWLVKLEPSRQMLLLNAQDGGLAGAIESGTVDTVTGEPFDQNEPDVDAPPAPTKFDADNPNEPCKDWDGMFAAAIKELGYKSIGHVKNTLKKGFPDSKGAIPEAWAYLVEYQSKKGRDDTYPTRPELLSRWIVLWEKAKVLGLEVKGFEESKMSDKDITIAIDTLTVRVTAKESEIK